MPGRTAALAAALVLSLAPLVAEYLGWIVFAGAPRVGLALGPWVVLAGVPRAGLRELALLLALPVVALAAAVDRAGGAASAFELAAGGLGLVALGALGAARGARVYAALWFGVACVPAGLATAFALSAAGGEPVGLGAWILATPWVWTARAIAGAQGSAVAALALAALPAAVGVVEGAAAARAGRFGA